MKPSTMCRSPAPASIPVPEVATRAKQRAKQQIQQNRFVIIGAGAIVIALLIFVATSMPHRGAPQKVKSRGTTAARRLGLGERQRKQRKEPISRNRFWPARHKGVSRRLPQRTRSTANCNQVGGQGAGSGRGGNFGIDTTFRRAAGMASATLSGRLEYWRCRGSRLG